MYIAFKKVSFEEFRKSTPFLSDEESKKAYDNIKLPKRATKGSAGYEFFAPFDIALKAGEEISIPTGIRCYMPEDIVLMIYPRSGLGIRNRFQLNNVVGIVDSDFVFSDNEGHISITMINDNRKGVDVEVPAGKGFVQGVFSKFYTTDDDSVNKERNGGFGSTDGNTV